MSSQAHNETQIDIITQADRDDEKGIWNFSPCDNQLGYRLPFEVNGHTLGIGEQRAGSLQPPLMDVICLWLKKKASKAKL